MMPSDYQDVVIETLAFNEAQLIARVADLEADVDAYRLLAQQLLHALHHVTVERDVLRGQIRINRRRDRRVESRAA